MKFKIKPKEPQEQITHLEFQDSDDGPTVVAHKGGEHQNICHFKNGVLVLHALDYHTAKILNLQMEDGYHIKTRKA